MNARRNQEAVQSFISEGWEVETNKEGRMLSVSGSPQTHKKNTDSDNITVSQQMAVELCDKVNGLRLELGGVLEVTTNIKGDAVKVSLVKVLQSEMSKMAPFIQGILEEGRRKLLVVFEDGTNMLIMGNISQFFERMEKISAVGFVSLD